MSGRQEAIVGIPELTLQKTGGSNPPRVSIDYQTLREVLVLVSGPGELAGNTVVGGLYIHTSLISS